MSKDLGKGLGWEMHEKTASLLPRGSYLFLQDTLWIRESPGCIQSL